MSKTTTQSAKFITALALLSVGLLVAAMLTAIVAKADTGGTELSGEIGPGSSGTDVSTLQAFLATNSLIYPAGLVTGYYGPLTKTAVEQFQIGYGLPAVGNVGPRTLARINGLIAANDPIDVSAPQMSNIALTASAGSETITWTTNEDAKGTVYYSPNGVTSDETSVALTQPVISGTPVSETSYLTSHSVTLTGLQQGQIYYFIIDSTDTTGNVSITLASSFIAQ